MTPQELKVSILQQAIQGTLVKQRPEEGTGADLFYQIQAEKKALIKAGKIKKEKPLPEITEEEIPFDIPDTWDWVRVAAVTTLNPKNDLDDDLVTAFIPMPCVMDGFRNQHTFEVRKWKDIKKGFTHFANGDIGVAKITPCFQNRKSVIFCDLQNGYGAGTTELSIVRTIGETISREYLLWFFKTDYFITNGMKSFTGTAGQQRIHKDYLATCLLPLPPLAEQKRIVAKLEEILPLIGRYETAWNKLEAFNKRFPGEMQKSILQLAIQGKLVEQRSEEGTGQAIFTQLIPYHKGLKPGKSELNLSSMEFDIPESWTMVELNQLFDFVDYRGKTPNKISDGVFLITASNIRQGFMEYTRKEYISREEYRSRQGRGITEKGDLLFTTEAPMGNAALCNLDECSCGQRIITFKEYTKRTVVPALYMYFILSPAFQQQLLDNCTGTTAKGIKADKLKHFLLPLPPYEEQKRIVAKLEEILPLCDRLK